MENANGVEWRARKGENGSQSQFIFVRHRHTLGLGLGFGLGLGCFSTWACTENRAHFNTKNAWHEEDAKIAYIENIDDDALQIHIKVLLFFFFSVVVVVCSISTIDRNEARKHTPSMCGSCLYATSPCMYILYIHMTCKSIPIMDLWLLSLASTIHNIVVMHFE